MNFNTVIQCFTLQWLSNTILNEFLCISNRYFLSLYVFREELVSSSYCPVNLDFRLKKFRVEDFFHEYIENSPQNNILKALSIGGVPN